MRQTFGWLVFCRVFTKAPQLLEAFQANEYELIDEAPSDHLLRRHTKLFTEVVDLTVLFSKFFSFFQNFLEFLLKKIN